MKHSTETPRPPREFLNTIPAPLEEVVLHALEKLPGNRPPDAGAFRRELYATAERLGLEHAGWHTAPTIDSLRGAGTETPSGRLIVDMVRVREHRAAVTSGEQLRSEEIAREALALKPEPVVEPDNDVSPATEALLIPQRPSFSKVRVLFERPEVWLRWLRNPVVLTCVGLAVLILTVVIIAVVATRSKGKPQQAATNINAVTENTKAATVGTAAASVPTPTPEATPAVADPVDNNNNRRTQAARGSGGPRRRTVAAAPKKPQKRGFFNKLKRAIKNPF